MPPHWVAQAGPPHPALQSAASKDTEQENKLVARSAYYVVGNARCLQCVGSAVLAVLPFRGVSFKLPTLHTTPMLVYSHLQSAADVAPRSAVVMPAGQFLHVIGPLDTALLYVPAPGKARQGKQVGMLWCMCTHVPHRSGLPPEIISPQGHSEQGRDDLPHTQTLCCANACKHTLTDSP
jgi:hypothetical protein